MIELCRELNLETEDIIDKIVEKYHLSEQEARERVCKN